MTILSFTRKYFKVLISTAALSSLSLTLSAYAGPIFLTGHDPDFHSQESGADGTGAQNLLEIGLDFVTGGTTFNTSNKFLWVESRISPPSGHLVGEAGLGTLGLTLGTHYERTNGAELASVDFSDFTAIVVASSFGGLLTRAELDALIDRKNDIENFINTGGGLYAMAECDNCGADLLGDLPDLFGYLPIDVTTGGVSPPFTLTPFGASLGLVTSDLQSPTHNSFPTTGGLNIVDTDQSNTPITLAGDVIIDDDGFQPNPVSVPEPSFILGFLAFGTLGAASTLKRSN